MQENTHRHLHKLTCKITGLNGNAVTKHYQLSMKLLSSNIGNILNYGENNELQIVESIKTTLIEEHRENDAVAFTKLHQRLLKSSVLKKRWSLLTFLLRLKQETLTSNNQKCDWGLSTIPNNDCQLNLGNISYANRKNKSSEGNRMKTLLSYWQAPSKTPEIKVETRPVIQLNGNRNVPDVNLSKEISESVLLRELLYAIQGIEGKIIRFDVGRDGVWIDPKAGIPKPTREMLLKLTELGLLYNKIRKYCDARANDKSMGLVGQSFAAALQLELTQYYQLLAVFESELQQDDEQGIGSRFGGLTLRRLQIWTIEPLVRLKALAALVDICKGRKGGALASTIHSYLKHGDPCIRSIVKCILGQVSVPLYSKLRMWIIDGELDDNFHEFFVAADPNVNENRLWHKKYSLRKAMIPSFLSMNQAIKILSTGKSINFLRQVCFDRTSLKAKESIQATLENSSVESLFLQDHDGDLQRMIDIAYKETSSQVLNVMHTTYKFMNHLKAIRRYLLLGQGDFIRHLMDLLEAHLNKPASTLYLHSLTGILDTAIRSTNAQFDDPDILQRLDIRLLETSAGDNGWDVFTLYYHMDGPIGTVFTNKVLLVYLRLFNSLWRAKRMEYVLSGMWKTQMANSRMFKTLTELGPVLHQCHVLLGEMVHFVQQMQYYIMFEVMECSWDVLEKKVKSAEGLDQVIGAHEEFLDTIMTRALLDDSSMDILNQLRTIYDLIIQFQGIQDEFSVLALRELDLRQVAKKEIEKLDKEGASDVMEAKILEERQRQFPFVKSASSTRAQLRILAITYQDMVKKFLLMLTSHQDVSLQFLSFRLDFNEYYKRKDSRLQTPLTYQHRRLSSSRQSVK